MMKDKKRIPSIAVAIAILIVACMIFPLHQALANDPDPNTPITQNENTALPADVTNDENDAALNEAENANIPEGEDEQTDENNEEDQDSKNTKSENPTLYIIVGSLIVAVIASVGFLIHKRQTKKQPL